MKLHVACGNRVLDGWINRDYGRPPKGTTPFNATKVWEYPDGYFDIVYCEDFIEHLSQPDQFKFFQQVYRTLKSGGCLRMNFPCVDWSLRNWIIQDDTSLNLDREYYNNNGGHVFLPTFGYLHQILPLFGFIDPVALEKGESLYIDDFIGDSRPVVFGNVVDDRPVEGQLYVECIKP